MVELAVQAIKHGALDFLTKPFSVDDLLLAISQGLERCRLSLETRRAEAARLKPGYWQRIKNICKNSTAPSSNLSISCPTN